MNRDVKQEADGLYQWEPFKNEVCSVEVGDFRFAGQGEDTDLVFVLDKMNDEGVDLIRVALVTTWEAQTIESDILIKEEESGLPFDVWIRTSIVGWIHAEKVSSDRVGNIEGELLDQLTHLSAEQMRKFRRQGRTGSPLAVSDDVRWLHEQDAMRHLNKMGAGYLLDGVLLASE